MAAQSHVKVSFEYPEYTANVGALGVLRLLEAVRLAGLQTSVKFFQAFSSDIFASSAGCQQDENTLFDPKSPYGAYKQHNCI